MSHATDTGTHGENLAEIFLKQKGYDIRHRHFRFRNGELDIVAESKTFIVIVEVKTTDLRRHDESAFGEPETWLTPKKQKFLKQAAEYYLVKYPAPEKDCRFDLITVRLRSDGEEIRHIENAFWM